MDREDFCSAWEGAPGIEVPSPPGPQRCVYATAFHEWAAGMCRELLKQEPLEASTVHYAKHLLTERYFTWRNSVPTAHRNCLGTSLHQCILSVWLEVYEQLTTIQLSLSPLPFLPTSPSAPAEPPPPPISEVWGVYAGDVVDEPEKNEDEEEP